MRLVSLLLVGLLALTACSSDDGKKDARSAPTSATSDAPTVMPTPTPPEAPSVAEFCRSVRAVSTGSGAERMTAATELLSKGLPDELDAQDRRGLQVLVDLVPSLDSVSGAVSAYRDLDREQRRDLRSLGGFVVAECGRDLIADLMPDFPDLPDLPKLPGGLKDLVSR